MIDEERLLIVIEVRSTLTCSPIFCTANPAHIATKGWREVPLKIDEVDDAIRQGSRESWPLHARLIHTFHLPWLGIVPRFSFSDSYCCEFSAPYLQTPQISTRFERGV